MNASDYVYACRSRHGSLRPTRYRSQALRQGQVATRPQSPVQITPLSIIALPHSQGRNARQSLAYALPYRRFAAALAGDRARLRVDAVCYSFIVSDLHRLLLAGLSGALRKILDTTN
jgi:hypothetical protein